MFSTVQMIDDESLERKTCTRFLEQMTALRDEGFRYIGTLAIQHGVGLAPAALVFGNLGREVWKFTLPLQVNWHHPMMQSRDDCTIAYPFGVGIRFYSFFDDGYAIRSSNTDGNDSFRSTAQLETFYFPDCSITETWQQHEEACRDKSKQGAQVLMATQQDVIDMQTREDSWQENLALAAIGWGIPLSALLGLVAYGMLK